jgi:hypothetical protein
MTLPLLLGSWPRTIDHARIVTATLKPPKRLGVTHWLTRWLTRHLGISDATIPW